VRRACNGEALGAERNWKHKEEEEEEEEEEEAAVKERRTRKQ
jgi:hypothetical protein